MGWFNRKTCKSQVGSQIRDHAKPVKRFVRKPCLISLLRSPFASCFVLKHCAQSHKCRQMIQNKAVHSLFLTIWHPKSAYRDRDWNVVTCCCRRDGPTSGCVKSSGRVFKIDERLQHFVIRNVSSHWFFGEWIFLCAKGALPPRGLLWMKGHCMVVITLLYLQPAVRQPHWGGVHSS